MDSRLVFLLVWWLALAICAFVLVAKFIYWQMSCIILQGSIMNRIPPNMLTIKPIYFILQMVPILNFVVAYIAAWNLSLSLTGWAHEMELTLDDAVRKNGMRMCHTGILFLFCVLASCLSPAVTVYFPIAAFCLWAFFVRQYNNDLVKINLLMSETESISDCVHIGDSK